MKTLLIACLLAHTSLAFAVGDVFLFGGGNHDPEGLHQFVLSAGGEGEARVLVIGWASSVPEESAQDMRTELAAAGVDKVEVSLTPPKTLDEVAQFESQCQRATALYFTGGDQIRILDAYDANPSLKEEVSRRWQEGVALAGTSAGTAALSKWVLVGNEDLGRIDPSRINLRPGLEVLKNVVVDQHFLVRQRSNRLISAILRYPGTSGVGIDEDNVLVVRNDGRDGQVYGPTAVTFFRPVGQAPVRIEMAILNAGQCWDFKHWRGQECL